MLYCRSAVNPYHAREGPMHGEVRISRPFQFAVVHIPVKWMSKERARKKGVTPNRAACR